MPLLLERSVLTMKRRDFLKTTAAVAVAWPFLSPAAVFGAILSKPQNLFFLTVDDMNWSMPGFMGNSLHLTPNLDKLAAASHCFVHTRTSVPICQPSREAMMTGRLPHHSGGLGFTPIYAGVPTLTTTLKAAGYYTAAIHKIDHMQPPSCFPWDYKVEGKGRAPSEYAAAVHQAILAARERQQPFFINCNVNDPHRPFYGSPEAAAVDHHEEDEYHVAREIQPEEVVPPSILPDLSAVRKEYAQYCNSVQRMDKSIGRVLDVLSAAPEADNTIIIFSADHGMPFPFSKATVYDYGSRTPTLLNYPGMGKPRVFRDRTCNIDYMPTLLDLLHIKKPAGMYGHSWVPLLHGKKYDGPNLLVTHVNSVSSGEEFPMRAIQDERYSLVFMPWADGKLNFRIESMSGLTYPAMREAAKRDPQMAARVKQFILGVPLAFYDLRTDPAQADNLIQNPAYADRIMAMKQALRDYMVRTNDPQLENWDCFLAGKQPTVQQPAHLNEWRAKVPQSSLTKFDL